MASESVIEFAFNGSTTNVDEIARILEQAKANYKGTNLEAFSRDIDTFVLSLRARLGDASIPVRDAFRILRDLQHSVHI